MPRPTATDKRARMSPKQLEFIEWLVAPVREPSNQLQWAAANAVNPTTLTRWKQDLAFREAWDARLQEFNIDPERIQQVIDAMHLKACKGSEKAMELYMKYVERFLPAPEPAPVERASDLSDEELEELIAETAREELAARAAS